LTRLMRSMRRWTASQNRWNRTSMTGNSAMNACPACRPLDA